MDYEKKYKMVLNRAREIHRNEAEKRFDMEWLFPELAESEDERIRKELIKETKGSEERLFEAITNEEFVAWLEKQGEHKQEWSETDENRFQNIIACIEDCYNEKDAQDLIRWFKSLRHHPKQVWSKEDENMANDLIEGCLSSVSPYQLTHTCQEIADWLKSIKDRVKENED